MLDPNEAARVIRAMRRSGKFRPLVASEIENFANLGGRAFEVASAMCLAGYLKRTECHRIPIYEITEKGKRLMEAA